MAVRAMRLGGTSTKTFSDRREAGRQLAALLIRSPPTAEPIVLALPRGGVPVAAEVAAALEAPLDVFVVRKLGAPFNRGLAIGAITTGGIAVYDRAEVAALNLAESDLENLRAREQRELERRERVYRHGRAAPALSGRTVIVVDDGMATGVTVRAAARAVRECAPSSVVVAVPTASPRAMESVEPVADRVLTLAVPDPYLAVGAWFEYFPEISDQDVVDIITRARRREDRG